LTPYLHKTDVRDTRRRKRTEGKEKEETRANK
jgi:hypothetical protein